MGVVIFHVPSAMIESESETATVEIIESDTATTSNSISILDRLKAPTKSDLARKRKIERPAAQTKKRESTTVSNETDPKNVTPAQRLKDFPNKCLSVRNGKLFCVACREVIALKKSTIKKHISSGDKHRSAKQKLASKEARERNIVQSLQLITLLAATSNMYSSRACAVCYVMIYDVLKHSTAQVVDAKQTRPSPAYERVWLHQTTPGVH